MWDQNENDKPIQKNAHQAFVCLHRCYNNDDKGVLYQLSRF